MSQFPENPPVSAEVPPQLFSQVRRFFVTKVGDDADRLTRMTFERVSAARDRRPEYASARAWIFGIAHNLLLEYVRAKMHDGDVVAESRGQSPAGEALPDSAEQMEPEVLEALRRLSLDHQIVLEYYYLQDLDLEQIAEALGISVNTARGRLTRARQKLREALAAGSTDDEID